MIALIDPYVAVAKYLPSDSRSPTGDTDDSIHVLRESSVDIIDCIGDGSTVVSSFLTIGPIAGLGK